MKFGMYDLCRYFDLDLDPWGHLGQGQKVKNEKNFFVRNVTWKFTELKMLTLELGVKVKRSKKVKLVLKCSLQAYYCMQWDEIWYA